MILDRGIYARVVNQHKGLNYPFDGGTAVVTGRHCCGTYFGYGAFDVPDFHLTGNAGAVRSLVQNADLAIANLEDPTPDNWIFHVFGIPFSGDPALLQMFTNAGIDWVTIANNHIDDYGASGIKDTMRHLPEYGLQFAGAGLNIDQASQYSVLDVHGVKVAILPCVAVFPSEWAKGSSKAGGMPCTDPRMIPNIQKAAAEDDFVIVFPHWGIEYTLVPIDSERKLAAQFMAAGADLILGAHPHVAQAVEDINGKLVFYSMGNFVFDQNWAEITMEGLLVESTFEGKHLMQTQMLPIIDADQSQPNLLDPNGSGKIVLQRMEKASHALGGHGVSDVDRPRIA